MRPEVITILRALVNKNPSISMIEKKMLNLLVEQQELYAFIDELKTEIQKKKDYHNNLVPFYDFYLAILLLKQNDIEEAKDVLADAVHGFLILHWDQNKAMGEWLFSTIHFENEDYDRAQRACKDAIRILRALMKQYNDNSKYENAKEIAAYLAQLEIFQESIIRAVDSPKSLLRHHKEKLENELEYLKRHKKDIPPTLVAAISYISRIITPAHIVYRKVPHPKTQREQEIYANLLAKVTFFEVIEKLVAIREENGPEFSREEILEKIDQEWDLEVGL